MLPRTANIPETPAPDRPAAAAIKSAHPALLSIREVGAIFGRTERSIRRWIRSGHLASIRVGGAVFIHPDDVAALVSRHVRDTERPHREASSMSHAEPQSGGSVSEANPLVTRSIRSLS